MRSNLLRPIHTNVHRYLNLLIHTLIISQLPLINSFPLPGIDDEEMAKILKWSKFLRTTMIIVSVLCIITSWYNLAVSTNSVSTNFLAVYVFFFSMMICCYELALKQVAVLIVQNFGFMYNPIGRSIFLMFLAILLFQLSTMGVVMFAVLLAVGILQIYVDVRHPKFETYKRTMHFYNKASASKKSKTQMSLTTNPMSPMSV
jgi:uncharacterized membrane protein